MIRRTTMKRRTWSKLLAVAFLALGTGWAQEEADAPGRGVARLSLLNGDVSVRRGDSGDWIAGAVNTALVVQDHVVTGAASRAEVQFDWANMLRLASHTEVRLAELEYRRYQVQVARGTVTLGVLRDSDAETEVNTPNVSVRPLKRGLYRVMVREDGQTEVTVRSGEVEVYTPRGTERLTSGRAMLVRGTASDPEYQIVRAVSEDDWDRWNENRNRQLERSRSYSYVSRHIYGADDLDAHGRWIYDPAYGWVWAPYGVGPTWAPYRHGRWVWMDWYGWSWHSYDPWGWAPFHYGRWYHHVHWGWCWWPGYRHHHHYWRPGLVAFFGWGRHSGLHIGVGFGHIGWVPLAPHEPFYPWYGHRYYSGYRNRVYVDNSVNIVNNINITNVYRNARVNNGVSGIEAGEFGRGRAVRAINRSEVDFARSGLVRGAVPVTPRAESLRVADRNVQAGNLPRTSDPGRFYSRRPAANVERVPFEQQRQGVEQMVRRGLGGGAPQTAEAGAGGNLPRTGGGAVRGGDERTGTGNVTRGDRQAESGWRRIGEPTRSAEGATQPDTSRGVRVFGEPVTRPGSAQGGRQLERRAEEPARRSGGAEEGWRRFGSPAGQPERTDRTPDTPARDQGGIRRESSEGWNRFGTWRQPERGDTSPRMATPRSEESPSRIERRSGAESRTEPPRSSAPREEGARQSGESIRMSPPIVRERSTPRSESPRSEAPRYESQRYERPRSESPRMESPRYERPQMSSPRYERPSAPSGRMSGGEVRGGGSMPRGEAPGGTRSGGGRGRER
ncbi:MAG: hypothetical protein FJW34_24210 [Acidobacteria bacterium]|nr:hypothetical protein [Acidobacteriota bacterium]